MTVSFWTTTNPAPPRAEPTAAAVKAAGGDGLTVTDSQNLSGDAEPRRAERSNALFLIEVLPALRGRPTRSP